MSQLRLAIRPDDVLRGDLLRALADAIDGIGHKQVAAELDISPSQLSNALAGRNNNRFNAEWVAIVVRMDKSNVVLRTLGDSVGLDLVAQAEIPKPDLDAALDDVAREELGPEIYAALRAKARRRARESR